jgi:hypothetical protein
MVANNFDLSLGILDQLGWNLSIVSLTYTSESLPQGGLYDLLATWSPPHRLRKGTSADLALVPVNERTWLFEAIYAAGLSTPVAKESILTGSADHWHIEQ